LRELDTLLDHIEEEIKTLGEATAELIGPSKYLAKHMCKVKL
jgi:hypothetical protein